MDLSIDENLRYARGLRQVDDDLLWERSHKYLTLMSLEQFGDRLAGELSGGMKQKLALCCALVSQPQVLLLDDLLKGVGLDVLWVHVLALLGFAVVLLSISVSKF